MSFDKERKRLEAMIEENEKLYVTLEKLKIDINICRKDLLKN